MRFNRSGFTLIELIVVVVIIGILASIAAPMMQGIRVKAICAEAQAALGTLATALRTYEVANGTVSIHSTLSGLDSQTLSAMGISPNDFTGTYFSKDCYYIDYNSMNSGTSGHFNYVYCAPDPVSQIGCGVNDAIKADEAKAILDTPNAGGYLELFTTNGLFRQGNISRSGFPNDDWSEFPDGYPK